MKKLIAVTLLMLFVIMTGFTQNRARIILDRNTGDTLIAVPVVGMKDLITHRYKSMELAEEVQMLRKSLQLTDSVVFVQRLIITDKDSIISLKEQEVEIYVKSDKTLKRVIKKLKFKVKVYEFAVVAGAIVAGVFIVRRGLLD